MNWNWDEELKFKDFSSNTGFSRSDFQDLLNDRFEQVYKDKKVINRIKFLQFVKELEYTPFKEINE